MKKKLTLNTITSLLLHVITLICGFILPRLILEQYGSEINGLIQSITQFLGVISLLELGVGQVIQSALYKPIVDNNKTRISEVLASGSRFFRSIARFLVIYVLLLILVYPLLIDTDYEWYYTAAMLAIISMGSFAQYYFGIIDNILLNADQCGYIQYISQIVGIIINTICCVVLINNGVSIHFVKLVSAVIHMIRPFVIRLYINKKYEIDRNIRYDIEPIKQKWNGIAQHVSAFILNGTDNIVLTLFSTLENVSIYAVYHLITYGVHQVYTSATAGLHSYIGNLWAKQDLERLNKVYGYMETVLHFSTVFLFTCTGILILPFITIYTQGVTDVNYIQPVFGTLLVLAHAIQCIKTTYNIMILAGGHYNQTQKLHIISAALNMIISIFMVAEMGLIGVAIGTVVSMLYQTVCMAIYDSKNLLKWPIYNFIKQVIVDIVAVVFILILTSRIELKNNNYFSWFVMAIKVVIIAALVILIMTKIFYPDKFEMLIQYISKKVVRKKSE